MARPTHAPLDPTGGWLGRALRGAIDRAPGKSAKEAADVIGVEAAALEAYLDGHADLDGDKLGTLIDYVGCRRAVRQAIRSGRQRPADGPGRGDAPA